jgi:hypothetical protein
MLCMNTKQEYREAVPSCAVPHLQVAVREAQRYVYVRWAWREKVNPRRTGKVRGTGRSRMHYRSRYIGVEAEVIALLLRSSERRRKR